METIRNAVQLVYLAFSVLGAIVVIWGVIEAILNFLFLKFSSKKKEIIPESESIRQKLGAYLLLGLEIFIAGDIISSVVSPTWQKVGMLAAIVAIRTVLSYFLRMELKQSKG